MREWPSEQLTGYRDSGTTMTRLDLVNLNTRVTSVTIGKRRASSSKAMSVLVENNVALIFNELNGISEYTSN